jgi:leucyl aminopeptidase
MTQALFDFPQAFLDTKRKHHVPVIPVTVKDFTVWLKKQTAGAQAQIRNSNFVAKPQQGFIVRSDKGDIATVLAGVSVPVKYYDFAGAAETIKQALPAAILKDYSFYIESKLSAEDSLRAHVGWGWAAYQFVIYKKPLFGVPCLVWDKNTDKKKVQALTQSIYLLRNLVNTPANDMGPDELEAAARAVAKKFKAEISVIQDKALQTKNFPMIYAVGHGSERRPRLIDMRWGDKKNPLVTFVGKGVCFDTGGLDLKPPPFMLLMKKDMGGAAHALAAAWIVMSLNLPIQLRILIPAVENATSGGAYRPGDILQTRKGITVEIGDTDAEGRLVVGDALAYAAEEKNDLIIDFTTLTGSARAALGFDIPGVFSTKDKLADELKNIAMSIDDPVWPLPLWEPYRKEMDTPYADINNIGTGKAGAIHGALFLKEFVPAGSDWLHLDLYAWEQFGRPGRPRGGADTGLRAIISLLEERYGARKKRK